MSNSDLELFEKFKVEMLKEYYKHYSKNGDSWKDCEPYHLFSLLLGSVEKHSFNQLKENPSHFIDVANFSLFCYYRFLEYFSTLQSKETSE